MELSETINTINDGLVNLFGREANSHQPMFRVVWSEDQFEKRMMDTTDEGLQLLSPEIRVVPKYRQWIKERYVLERLVIVPEFQQKELADAKVSYEPLWVFETQLGVYLPPRLDAAKFCIDTLYAALGKKSMAKYKDPEAGQDGKEYRKQKVNELQEAMFGNESNVTDALAYRTGVTVPGKVTIQ